MIEDQIREVARATELIKVILADRAPEVQGAILADLLAIWLAGHHIPGDPGATNKMRRKVLEMLVMTVEQLTVANAEILGTEPT